MSELSSASPEFEELLQQTHDLLVLVSRVAEMPELLCLPAPVDAGRAGEAIAVATAALKQFADVPSPSRHSGQVTLLLAELGTLQFLVKSFELARRNRAVSDLNGALGRLHSGSTVDDLVERVPREIVGLGFTDSLFSWVDHQRWIPRAAYTRSGPEEARAVVAAGVPYLHTRDLVESEVVRDKKAILVRNTRDNPRVHDALLEVTPCDSYVAAPMISNGQVIGFLHAHGNCESGEVGEFDRDLIASFAQGLGFAYERANLMEELAKVRSGIKQHAAALEDLMGELGYQTPASPRAGVVSSSADDPEPMKIGTWGADLTRREVQILGLVATGCTNAQIAERLYIAEGTAKSHVQSILRKLGATNRAEAGAMYHRHGWGIGSPFQEG